MSGSELISGPGSLFALALAVGVGGAALFAVANLIMKVTGQDINEHARETERYRDMGFAEQMNAIHSDARNIPVAVGGVGLLLLFGALVLALGSGGWYLVRLVSG